MPWLICLWIAVMVLSYLLRPPPQTPSTPEPGRVETTTVDQASPVPVLFGTRVLKQVNCVWYGDVGTTPIVKCSSGGGKK